MNFLSATADDKAIAGVKKIEQLLMDFFMSPKPSQVQDRGMLSLGWHS